MMDSNNTIIEAKILKLLPTPVGYINRGLVYQYVNPAYARSIGKELPNIIGRHVSEVLGEQALSKVQPRVDTVLSGEAVTFENTLQTPAGTKHLLVTFTPDCDQHGIVQGFTTLVVDVTSGK